MIRYLLIGTLLSLSSHATETITVESSPQKTAVVELYTSEGCSSCPPADQWLGALVDTNADDLNVLALAFHVDYWDYIGWKDPFANPQHTSRQRQLGTINQQRTIYTPEFFVGGKETRGTTRVLDEIRTINQLSADINVKLTVSKDNNQLKLILEDSSDDTEVRTLHHRYFVYEKNLSSNVTRGENSGETLRHQQVVRFMSPAYKFDVSNHYLIDINPDWRLENIGVAALITSSGSETYLQAIHTPIADLVLE